MDGTGGPYVKGNSQAQKDKYHVNLLMEYKELISQKLGVGW
jgi:hypothetical protein